MSPPSNSNVPVSLLNAVIVLELLLWKETAHYFIMSTAWSPDFQPVYVISCDSIAFLDKAVFYLRKFNLSRLCFCMALRIFMYLSPSWEFFSLINSKRHGCIYFGFYYIKGTQTIYKIQDFIIFQRSCSFRHGSILNNEFYSWI